MVISSFDIGLKDFAIYCPLNIVEIWISSPWLVCISFVSQCLLRSFVGKLYHNLTAFMLSLWLVSHIKWPNRIATHVPDWHCDTTMWRPCFSWMFWVTPESCKQKNWGCVLQLRREIDRLYSQIMSNCMIWQFMPVKRQPKQPFQKWCKSMENRNRWCNFWTA